MGVAVSSCLYRLGRWSFRRGKTVVALWIAVLAVIGGGALALQQPTQDGFSIPGTESQRALDALASTFPQVAGSSAQIVIVAPDGQRINGPESQSAIGTTVANVAKIRDVSAVSTPFGPRANGGISARGDAALLTVQLDKATQHIPASVNEALITQGKDLQKALPEGSSVSVGGQLFAALKPAGPSPSEALGLAIALVVLLITFGSFAAAGLPLIAAVTGVGLTYLGITLATAFTTISSSTPALAVMLGLAVGIDYALFVLARHFEQLRQGMKGEESAARAVGTAGSAVVFAGITVIIALVGLSVVNVPFLSVMGVAAAVAVALSVLITLTLVPALLGIWNKPIAKAATKERRRRIGTRRPQPVEAGTVAAAHDNGHAASQNTTGATRFFSGWVKAVTRRPVVTIVAVITGLVIASVPLLSLRLALPDAGSQNVGTPARETYDVIAKEFGPGYNGPLIVTGSIANSKNPVTLMADLKNAIQALPGVANVPLATPNPTADTGIIQVIPNSAPDSAQTKALVHHIRELAPSLEKKYGVALSVTGFTAIGIDVSDVLGNALLPFIALIVGLALILLMMVFRSIWVPVTAALGFLLTIGTAFGVVTAVFDWGWLADAFGLAKAGPVISFMPVILIGVLFGLAMDYEVFLVSRIREAYVHGATPRDAIRAGFLSSGRVVSAAALIMFAVFAAFVPAGDSAIKPIALGLAVGVAVDAFIVRMTLMPALLHLLNHRAWSMPAWLDRLLPSFDIEGEGLRRKLEAEQADAIELGGASDRVPVAERGV